MGHKISGARSSAIDLLLMLRSEKDNHSMIVEASRNEELDVPVSTTHRQMVQESTPCVGSKSFATYYNSVDDVPPYAGIMFEMVALAALDITTFELDVRVSAATNLSIAVFSKKGTYNLVVNDPTAWEQIANATLSPQTNRAGLIIPAVDFAKISMAERETRSFYISMTGPFLDYTVNALQKTGEMSASNSDVEVLVGSGFNDVNFLGPVDTILHPQFAGVIRYDKKVSCDSVDTRAQTVINYQFLFEQEDESQHTIVDMAIDAAVDSLLASNPTLQQFADKFQLQKAEGARSNVLDGICKLTTASQHHKAVLTFVGYRASCLTLLSPSTTHSRLPSGMESVPYDLSKDSSASHTFG